MTSFRILLATAAALVFGACAHSSDGRVDAFLLVGSLTASNGAAPFAGDTRRLTTISPNGDGLRDAAAVRFSLSSAAPVHVEIAREAPAPHVVYTTTVDASAGDNTFRWAPAAAVPPRTYVVRLTVGAHRYGAYRHLQAAQPDNVVVRVQGVDAAFGAASYRPGERAALAVATDAHTLTVQLFRIDDRAVTTHRNDVMQGRPVSRRLHVDWRTHANRPHDVVLRIGRWRSGVYFARVTANDGRVGFAPFVVAPSRLGEHRIAIVLPTNTWQAYNFYDRDGDGWGDTWYAAWTAHTTRLGRPFIGRGVPPHFASYDLPFLRWALHHRIGADYLSDADLERVISGDRLAHAYDLVAFPGHHEYVTEREYDVVRRYRDLGGNLAWLSANNFFWKVVRHGPVLERVARWRTLGKPEASLIGVQYRGSDEGERRRPFVVRDDEAAPWLFRGTGLHNGSRFGAYGIEIDARAQASPPGTKELASIPHIYGPRFTAEMTYYETAAGAKVFAAGAFTLAGDARRPVVDRLLVNLFGHLRRP